MFEYKIVDSNRKYNDIDKIQFDKLSEILDYNMWKNDICIVNLLIYSQKDDQYKLDLELPEGFEAKVYHYKKNLAYTGKPFEPIPVDTEEERIYATDILIEGNEFRIGKGEFNSFVIEFNSKKASSGLCKISINNKVREINFLIQEREVPNDRYDIELWQYPYSVAEYYGLKPFSEEHKKILKKHLKHYKNIGGDAIVCSIVEDAWDGQTYSKNKIHYPSMIKWTLKDGVMDYDFSDFDQWIKTCEEIGLGQNKIILYGMAPWHFSFTYFRDGELVKEKFEDAEDYEDRWEDFLDNLYLHLDELGIFEKTYIGIDERGFGEEIFSILDDGKKRNGRRLKISAAIDNFKENGRYSDRIDYVSVALKEYENDRSGFFEYANERRKKGFKTSLYSCVGHKPGNYALSHPGETLYTIVNSSVSDGFLRWAYDAWVEDPLHDATHKFFEPGDCFLVYPDSLISIRYLKIKEAIKWINKLRNMFSREDLFEVFEKHNTKFLNQKEYLSEEAVDNLIEDIENLRGLINEILA